MFFYADLHIHSKYSRATSRDCNLENLAIWAKKKGLSLIGTGDFTHPAWFSEIKEKLVPAENGTFRLHPDIEKQIFTDSRPVRFILTVEISTIYKKNDRTRKVHHVVFVPGLESAENFRQKLGAIGNINSDGRPILGLDSRNLLETVLESGEGSYIIPAHIWTPWFSVLGSKSGFDSIEECYEDLADHIFAVETGLSSDPEMNWRVSKLDKYRLVSNSDAHSPSKLAREATVFDTETDYFSIMDALKTGNGYVGTVEFFPEEGKYHEDGHRKCNICMAPEETGKYNGICPVCGKPMTIGVLNRVCELADRGADNTFRPNTAGQVYSLVPLPEIISEILGVGVASKSVTNEYNRVINKFGSELSILREVPIDELSKDSPLLGEGISRLRNGKVIKHPGFDGEYGVIRLFDKSELVKKNFINLKLDIDIPSGIEVKSEDRSVLHADNIVPVEVSKETPKRLNTSIGLDDCQQAAVQDESSRLLIVAGPGSGKTTVLTKRLAHLISDCGVSPEECLAITFTKKAAKEMKERLQKLLGNKAENIAINTFHSLCFAILKENYEVLGLDKVFRVITNEEKLLDKDIQNNSESLLGFDDLIILTLKLFNEHSEILKLYQGRYKYVSVDEYQDIDENQYNLIKFLVPSNGNICVIGDPNQAIYGFRGGDSKFFNNFTSDYPDAKLISLKNNYRSTNTIVDASNQMIESYNIISKYDKPHEKITIHTAPTDKAEAEFVVSTIENMIGGHSFFSMDSDRSEGENESYSFSDFAILYRTSAQLKPLIEALQRSGMPYAKYSNDLLCENKYIHKILQCLTDGIPVDKQLPLFFKDINGQVEDYILKYLEDLAVTYPDKNDFIHEVSLLTEVDIMDERADRISLMSLHSSKGLEFRCVFITGLEDGIIPLYKAQTQEEKEEEKRLLYVGMTRAEERLFLSHSLRRFWLGSFQNLPISPFLEKIKNDLLKYSKFEKERVEENKPQQLSLF